MTILSSFSLLFLLYGAHSSEDPKAFSSLFPATAPFERSEHPVEPPQYQRSETHPKPTNHQNTSSTQSLNPKLTSSKARYQRRLSAISTETTEPVNNAQTASPQLSGRSQLSTRARHEAEANLTEFRPGFRFGEESREPTGVTFSHDHTSSDPHSSPLRAAGRRASVTSTINAPSLQNDILLRKSSLLVSSRSLYRRPAAADEESSNENWHEGGERIQSVCAILDQETPQIWRYLKETELARKRIQPGGNSQYFISDRILDTIVAASKKRQSIKPKITAAKAGGACCLFTAACITASLHLNLFNSPYEIAGQALIFLIASTLGTYGTDYAVTTWQLEQMQATKAIDEILCACQKIKKLYTESTVDKSNDDDILHPDLLIVEGVQDLILGDVSMFLYAIRNNLLAPLGENENFSITINAEKANDIIDKKELLAKEYQYKSSILKKILLPYAILAMIFDLATSSLNIASALNRGSHNNLPNITGTNSTTTPSPQTLSTTVLQASYILNILDPIVAGISFMLACYIWYAWQQIKKCDKVIGRILDLSRCIFSENPSNQNLTTTADLSARSAQFGMPSR